MSFDTLAPHYRWMEKVVAGNVLQRARLAHLAALDEAREVLLVGEGPGRFLGPLRQRRPDAHITVLDQSPAMLAQARQVDASPLTSFVVADLRSWSPLASAGWDAVVTHCVLDCFDPSTLRKVINTLASALGSQAHWLLTDFTVPKRPGWRRLRARGAHALMYGAFRLLTGLEARRLTPPEPWLSAAGFTLQQRQTFNHDLIHADHWQRA
jgi:SAM-dependent methyltransferase